MIIYSIYKATNIINGKSYIGATSYPLTKRKWSHKSDIFHKKKTTKTKFHNAVRKYGWETFEWTVLYQSFDKEYIFSEMENFFITQFNSIEEGYNTGPGGNSSVLGLKMPKTLEHREKLRLAQTGKKYSDKTKALLSAIHKKNWDNPERRIKARERMLGNTRRRDYLSNV